MNRKEKEIVALIESTVAGLGCEVWGVEYFSQGKHSRLRIYIDKAEGVDISDCEKVSRHVSDLLDVADTLVDAYTLEVSSPGLDRILFTPAQYAANVGAQVDVRLNYPFEGRKRFVGVLVGIEDESAVVQIEDEQYLLPIENVQRARLVPQFE